MSTPTRHSAASLARRPERVLAFDPGFERLGVALIVRDKSARNEASLLFSDCLRTPAKLPFPERLALLGREVEALFKKLQPDAVALEEVYFEKNAKTAMQVARVCGMLSYLASSRGLAVFEYTPMEVKVAVTGYGKSGKADIALMVPRLIELPARKRLDDELDAIAIGLTCLAVSRGFGR